MYINNPIYTQMASNYKADLINDIVKDSHNRTRESFFCKNYNELYKEIIEYTINLKDIKFPFRIWHWINNEPNYIRCYCGNRVSQTMNWRNGYKKYCSNKCSSNSNKTKEKTKKTILEKYGVDHYSKTKDYVNKVKKTSLEKWGVDNYAKTEEYLKKSKETYLSKWGVDNFTKTEEYLKKSKKTFLERWGVEHPTQSEEIRNKIKKTNNKKWGKPHIFMSNEYRVGNFKISNHLNYISYENGVNIFKCDCNESHNFEITTDDYYGRTKSGNKLCTVCFPISSLSSIKENMISSYLKSIYDGEIIHNYRDKFEIDIYLPSLKIGFEFNGIYWHSDKFKDRKYHLNKKKYFNEKGIKLIHIWEDDWVYSENIIKSQLKNWIGLIDNKIWARKCEIKLVGLKESKSFLNDNHIQGSDRSNLKLGLYYNGDLVSLMTFNKSEGRKKMKDSEWNLSRFCNKINTTVVGGASKLFKNFLNNYDVDRVVSYADNNWSSGELYYRLGFNILHITEPDYKYVVNGRRIHKSRYRKSITGISESELKLLKIWDCGKIKFEYLKNDS